MLDESMRRRRECLKCENRFTTYEKIVLSLNVIKKDGRQQEFEINKITRSLEKACSKAADEKELQELSKKIEQKILSKKMNPIKTAEIGKIVLQELKKVDKMAYLRYASVYKNIEDVKMLEKEIGLVIG
jgi:transcriptional repressor NrdR